MMAHKHLHELLREDQEPFQLKSYIAERRCQLKTTAAASNTTTLQLKKRKPIADTTSTRSILCNHVCLFSFQDSPDVRKSPFLEFPSPAKSPGSKQNNPNATVFLHIPARTAAILLDAAMRIQKQSSKPKTQNKNAGFGLLGAILKRLKDRSIRTKRNEIGTPTRKSKKTEQNVVDSGGVSGALNQIQASLSCSDWSDSVNEDKSLDLETSCSSRSGESSEEIEINHDFDDCQKCFSCSSSSPFRFSLQKSPASPGRRTPNFLSPVTSPSRHYQEEKESDAGESSQECHLEEEEEKEQCSPVSVLDTPFEDDDDEEGQGESDEEEDGYDLECNYASIQRAKELLLQKLRRFERLAELDPVELEKRMLEHEDDKDVAEEEERDDYEYSALTCEEKANEYVNQVLSKLGIHPSGKIPGHMKMLVSDIITEENKNEQDTEVVAKKVCKRLDSWQVVDSNTIDMMVELDFRREIEGWKRSDVEQIRETGMEIEVAVFGLLVEELSEELVSFAAGR